MNRRPSRLRVEPITCHAHGICQELLPELIRLDEWGYPIIDPVPFDGDLDDYRDWLFKTKLGVEAAPEQEAAPPPQAKKPVPAPAAGQRAQKRREAEDRQRQSAARKPLELRLKRIDEQMAKVSAKKAAIDARLADPVNAVTVLRAKLDPWLAGKCEQAGALIMPGVRVDQVLTEGGRVAGVRAGDDELRARVVVAADGVNSFIAKQAGLRPKEPLNHLAVGVKSVISLPRETIEARFGRPLQRRLDGIGQLINAGNGPVEAQVIEIVAHGMERLVGGPAQRLVCAVH